MKLVSLLLCLGALAFGQGGPQGRNNDERAAAARLLPAPPSITVTFNVNGSSQTIDLSKIPNATEFDKNRLIVNGAVRIADLTATETPQNDAAFALALRQEYAQTIAQMMANPLFAPKAAADAAAAAKKTADADAKAQMDIRMKELMPAPTPPAVPPAK